MKVLMVDDDEGDILLTQESLDGIDIDLAVARDGQECLDYLRDTPKADWPRIILMDINMPRLNGHETLAKLKENPDTRKIPVIMLTTSSDDADIDKSFMEHAQSYVTKPVTLEAFKMIMQQLKDYWTDTSQTPQS